MARAQAATKNIALRRLAELLRANVAAAMADVIGEIIGMKQQPSGIRVGQMRVPIGVFGMIFESLPNVTIEAASLSWPEFAKTVAITWTAAALAQAASPAWNRSISACGLIRTPEWCPKMRCLLLVGSVQVRARPAAASL
jgi:hypothetical protein